MCTICNLYTYSVNETSYYYSTTLYMEESVFDSLTHTSDLYTMHAMKQEEFLEKLDINVTKTDINIAKGQPIA